MEFFAVGEDVLAGVPIGEAEIEDFVVVELGDTAGGGAETVGEPGEFGERFELEDF